MPAISIEFDDKGELIAVPAELDAIFKRTESAAYGQGYGKGVEKAAAEAKKQIEDAIAQEKARLEAQAPLEKEKYEQAQRDNDALKARMLELDRETSRTLRQREETHAKELVMRSEREQMLTEKYKRAVAERSRQYALEAGAREDALDEIQIVIEHHLGFEDDMEPYIKAADGTKVMVQGKPQTLKAFVSDYLNTHAFYLKPRGTGGGGARGGAFLQGHSSSNLSLDAAQQKFHETRSNEAINEIFEATRRAKQRPA